MVGDFIAKWAPLLLLIAVVLYFSRRQMKSHGQHVERVMQINEEILDLSRKSHAATEDQLAVLKQIKTLLEDRKS